MRIAILVLLIMCVQLGYAKDPSSFSKKKTKIHTKHSKNAFTTVMKPKIRYQEKVYEKYRIADFAQHLEQVLCMSDEEVNALPSVLHMNFGRYTSEPGAEFFTFPLEDSTQEYSIIRKAKSYYHPVTKEFLGSIYFIVGDAKVLETSGFWRLQVTKMYRTILPNDKVVAKRYINMDKNIKLVEKEASINGSVIGGLINLAQFGRNDNVVLDCGTNAGIVPGNILDILQPSGKVVFFGKDYKKVVLNNNNVNYVGQVLIYQVFDRLSVGVIVDSQMPIFINDKVT